MARSESGSIQKLGPNRWRVRVSGGNDPVTGKRIRKTKVVHGSKKDAIAERTRLQLQVGDVGRATSDITVAQYFEDIFLPWKKQRNRPNTYYGQCNVVRREIIPGIGHIKLDKLTAYNIEVWQQSIESPSMRKKAYEIVRQAIGQAYRWEILHKNIFDRLSAPSYSPGTKVVADAELAKMILGMVYGEPIEPAVLLQISCGLRLSEAVALDWDDIDLRAGSVRVAKSYQRVPGQGNMMLPTKTDRSTRTVAIPGFALARLKDVRTAGGVIRSGAVCVNEKGERMSPQAVSGRYKKLYDRELPGQSYIQPKNLRHSHAMILLEQDVDIKVIADRLGHADVSTTARYYLQPAGELDARASMAFDAAFAVARPSSDEGNVSEIRVRKEA